MFLREMNPLHGLRKKEIQLQKKKAQGIPGTGRSESQNNGSTLYEKGVTCSGSFLSTGSTWFQLIK